MSALTFRAYNVLFGDAILVRVPERLQPCVRSSSFRQDVRAAGALFSLPQTVSWSGKVAAFYRCSGRRSAHGSLASMGTTGEPVVLKVRHHGRPRFPLSLVTFALGLCPVLRCGTPLTMLDLASRDPSNRRRNAEGELRGFKLSFCRELLSRLLNLQDETGLTLITSEEIEEVREIWMRREQLEKE